jgi:hypothetical protein
LFILSGNDSIPLGEVGIGPIEQQRTIMTPAVGEQVNWLYCPTNAFVACLYAVDQSGRVRLPDPFDVPEEDVFEVLVRVLLMSGSAGLQAGDCCLV